MSEKSLVSVIIPVKEKNKYYDDVISDLSAQTYDKVEIITEEGDDGASAARNRGLKKACGKYVIFCDADDRLSPDYVSILVNAIESHEDASMAACGYEVLSDTGERIKTCNSEKDIISCDDMLLRLFDSKIYQGYVWNKIFIKSEIEKCGLSFDESIRYNEDRLFIYDYMVRTQKKAAFSNDIGYSYMIRSDSVMGFAANRGEVTDAMMTELYAFDKMLHHAELCVIMEKNELPQKRAIELVDAIRQEMIQRQLWLFKNLLTNKDIFKYKNHPLRAYAKSVKPSLYVPRAPMEDILIKIYRRYALFGVSYTSHPEYFKNVGVWG